MPINEDLKKHDHRIEAVLNKWGLSDQIVRGRKRVEIQEWFWNFEPSEVDDVLLILEKIDVVSQAEINDMLKTLSEELRKIFNGDLSDVKAYPLGNYPSSSGGNFLYSLCKNLGIWESFTPYKPLSEIDLSGVKALVFIDDIIGFGSQAIRFAKDKLAEIDIEKYYITLFAFEEGLERVKTDAGFTRVISAKILSDEYKAFSPRSHYFTDTDVRERLKGICAKYGKRLYPKHPLGYENSQSLLVFPHNVPNNTLPIIWAGPESESEEGVVWKPVWKRIKIKRTGKNTPHTTSPEKTKRISGDSQIMKKPEMEQNVTVIGSTDVTINQSSRMD